MINNHAKAPPVSMHSILKYPKMEERPFQKWWVSALIFVGQIWVTTALNAAEYDKEQNKMRKFNKPQLFYKQGPA